MKIQIVYLNVYGNAEILAKEMADHLDGAELVDLSRQEITDDAGVYLLAFELTQNAIPMKIMDVLEALEGKMILCAAACNMALYESRESVERNLLPFLPDECDYRGLFFCPGQTPSSVLDTIQQALDENPENKQAKAMLEAFRYAENHPDMEDLRDLRQFIRDCGI